MEIRQGTVVVALDIEVNPGTSGHGPRPLDEEIGIVLGLHDGDPFVRTRSWRGYRPIEKLIPICQTTLSGGGESELIVCAENELNKLLLQHLPEVIVSLCREIATLKRQSNYLAENKVQR